MDLKKALTAAARTGIMPFPALARTNNEITKNTDAAEKSAAVKGKKS